jgi:hypothetical protein
MKSKFGAVWVAGVACFWASTGLAQEAPEANEAAGADVAADGAAIADALEGVTEAPGKQYLFIGARYRNVIIPQFVQNWFADGGEGLYAHTPGLELGIRKDGFEYQIFAQLAMFSMTDVPYKGTTDADDAWELINASYKILFLGSDFLWSTDEFSPGLFMTYGAGVGLGLVFGDLTREQATPFPDGDAGDPYSYVRCGSPTGGFCDNSNDHYNGYVEPSWADNGSSPLILPWIAGNLGLRYKMHRNFVAHLDMGIWVPGAFIGLGAQYGL